MPLAITLMETKQVRAPLLPIRKNIANKMQVDWQYLPYNDPGKLPWTFYTLARTGKVIADGDV